MLNSGEKGRLTPTERKNKDMEADHQGEPGKARGKKSRDGESQGTHQTREPKPSST